MEAALGSQRHHQVNLFIFAVVGDLQTAHTKLAFILRLTAGSPSPADGGTDLHMEENSRFLTTSPAERRRASSNAALQRSPQAVTTVLPSPNTVITMRNGEDGEIEIRRSPQASSSSGGEGGGGSSESSSSSTGQQVN